MKPPRRVRLISAAVGLLLLVAPTLGFGAQDSGPLTIKRVDTSSYPRVVVDIGVEGLPAGVTVPEESFSVEENGRQVGRFDVEAVSRISEGMAVALVIDTSGSMGGQPVIDAKTAAATFIKNSTPRDRLAVVGFGSDPKVYAQLTSDKAVLLAAVSRLSATGETALYDGLKMGVDLLSSSGAGKKNLIVLSDGGDTTSKSLPEAVVSQAKSQDITIYAVALKTADYSGKALERVALPTGGKVILATTSAALVPFYAQLARDLHSEYRVIFESRKPASKDIRLSVGMRAASFGSKVEALVRNPSPGADKRAVNDDLFRTPAPKESGQGGLDLFIALIAIAAFSAVSLLGVIILAYAFREPSPLQEQLRFYEKVWKRSSAHLSRPEEEGTITAALFEVVSEIADKRGFTGLAQKKLEQAGLPLRPVEYMLFHFLFVLGAGILVFLSTKQLLLSTLALGIATAVPLGALQFLISRRMGQFNGQLPDTLGIMAGSLRAGYSLLQAVTAVVEESRPPISQEFRRVLAEARLGLPLEEALEKMAERVGSESFNWTVMAINIQREVGGNLAEVLDILAETLRERERMHRQIKALTAEGRLSASILIALPFVQAILFFFVNPAYMSLLFTHVVGWMMIILTAVFMVVGAIWVKSIVAIEV